MPNFVSRQGGATVDRGQIVYMGKDKYEVAYFPPKKQPWRALLGIALAILAVLAALFAMARGWLA